MNASELLREYRLRGSERAFAAIVREYADMVYSVAKRRLGNAALAEEAAQIVFTRLARRCPRLENNATLAGWLHRTTVHVAIDLWRTETRRGAREEKAMQLAATEESGVWEELVPRLDEALDKLRESDRQVLLLRFFERKRNAEVAAALGTTEDAAKMRVSRAIEKLRGMLAAQGGSCAAAALATLLSERAVEGAPAGLAAKLGSIHPVAGQSIAGRFRSAHRVAVGVGGIALITLVVTQVFKLPAPVRESAVQPRVANSSEENARVGPVQSVAGPAVRKVFDPITTRTKLLVMDSGRSAPIAAAAVHMVYFYDGGVGEVHKMSTNPEGLAALPFPKREGNPGANVFVTAQGYVPKCIQFRPEFPEEYRLLLDPAETIAGRVIDGKGKPVAGVKVTFRVGDINRREESRENIAFNAPETMSLTDSNGLFALPFAPKDWREVSVVLTAENYAITSTNYTRGEVEGRNLTVVIRPGALIYGQVTDSEGKPIGNAVVKELHNYGWRRLAATTTVDGAYLLSGVSDAIKPEARIVVQAEGMAAQARTVPLTQWTNRVDFTLAKSTPFRGRIVDPNGVPIMGAVIRTDSDNNGIRKYEWLDYSNVDGRFEWNAAPNETVLFWFEKEGYQTIRDLPLVPNGTEYQVTLRPPGLEPSGVTSADGRPIRTPRMTFRYWGVTNR